MPNTAIDLPTGMNDPNSLERVLQVLVRSALGQSGNGIPWALTQYDGTSYAMDVQSQETGNGNALRVRSQNTTYGITVTNAGTVFTGAPTFSAMTQGSVLFAGTGGLLSQDNSNLFWDDSNNRLGVNTSSPTEKLHVVGNARVSTFLGVGGAPDTTHALLVTGLSKFTSRMGVGGDPDATALLKITGALIGTGNATLGTNSGDTITVNGTSTFNENVSMVKDLTVDTDTLKVDATNNRVGVRVATPTTAFEVAGAMRSTAGTGVPTAGTGGGGLELYYSAGLALSVLQSYDRTASAFKDMGLYGLSVDITASGTSRFTVDGTGIGFFATTPVAKQTVTGTRTGTLAQLQTVVANMLTALANYGLWTDSTT